MDEIGPCEREAVPEGVNERAALDEHARYREPEDREPGESHEVHALEDQDARGRQRKERHRSGEERTTDRGPPVRRDHHRPDVAHGEGERPDDEPVDDARGAVEERGPDRERRRGQGEPEAGPEAVPVEPDRIGDQLADGPLGRRDPTVRHRHARHRIQ